MADLTVFDIGPIPVTDSIVDKIHFVEFFGESECLAECCF